MFLKSLEIRGFKSFADKTELKFDKGITAVVGPNGSGKSNVSDSVRWVLGEQSAKTLRGAKMEDIIFTGTQYRKPIGLASVSLTLDNTDQSLGIEFNEVKVTRRIFRSGESEYLINNSTCRLKDVVNLFMDTGIGKEGYSLIGQGKIEAILSGKAEDRRALLEEAAGIVKYKSRKNEAERKLKNTKENLTRINDIVFTYEERLGPLEEEKRKAEKYLMLAAELKDKDINLLVNNLIHINSAIVEKEETIRLLNDENNIEKEKQKNARENLRTLKEELEKLENDNNFKKELYLEKKEKIAQARAEISLLNERVKNYTLGINKANKDIEVNKEKYQKIILEIENLEKEIVNKKEEFKEFDFKIKEIDNNLKNINLEIKQKELEKENLKNKDIEAIKEVSNYTSKEALIENQIENAKEKADSINLKLEAIKSSLKINLLTKSNMENNLSKAIIEGEELLEKRNEVLEKKDNLSTLFKDIDFKIKENTSSLNKFEANKDMLKKLESQYEGYNVSVKKIMSHIDKGMLNINKDDSIILGEILNTKKGFETAIEISVAGAISNIVTKDEMIAKKMIQYLKEKKLGRATFLPLSVIRGKKIVVDKTLENEDGYLGVASDLVEYDLKYQNVVNYILGRTLICRDIDCAINIAKKSSYRYKIVTLSGEIVNAGGALTGGSVYQKNMGIISRKTEIEALEKSINAELLTQKQLVAKKEELKEKLQIVERKILEINDDMHKSEFAIMNIKNEIKKFSEDIFNAKTNSKNLTLEYEAEKNKESKLVETLEEVRVKILTLDNKGDNSKMKIENISLEIEKLLEIRVEIEKNATNFKIENASLKENLENKYKNILRLKGDQKELEVAINTHMKYKDESLKSLDESKENILSNNNFIVFEEEKLERLEEKTKDFDIYRAKLKDKLVKIEGIVEDLTLSIAKKDEEVHKHQIIYTRFESDKKNSSMKLVEQYDIDIETALANFVEIEDIEKHKASIYSLKNKIGSLGNVNVNAVEEFRELSDKYIFITTEKSDLENAQDELIQIIDEMTSKMRVIFRQNFNILNKNFDETFKQLFKGGSAELILDDIDELSGDIEIRVQPPGKKIQNINLMSGGEKVLSAIALLFGILKMKPTPFCILDEIEAALDDANVSRYAEFLKQFASNIQFIVITHRKGTMEVADTMYGVTMEEKGISKIVSVDLNKK